MSGIPSFRLEKDVVQAEIDILKEMGVEFKCGVEVGKDVTIAQLREQGYKGFYVAIGAQGGRSLGIAGEDAKGVESGISFICDVTLGIEKKLKGRTVVIGGGNVAVDVARTASRVGSAETLMFCLEDRDNMPADAEEVAEAEHEGIKVNTSWGPKEILVEKGKVKGIVFKKCISVFDDEHRFAPKYDETDLITVECDHILLSVGQSIVLGDLLAGTKVEFNGNGTVKADAITYQTAEKDIFVGGDVYTGPKFAIDAIAAVTEAAEISYEFFRYMSILSGNTILPLIYNSFRTSNRNLFERHIRLYGVKLTVDFMTQLFNLIAKGEVQEAISYLTNYYERSIKGDLEIYSE